MKHLYLATALVVSCVLAKAQDFDHYQTLLPQGPVPKDFTERSSAKVAVDISSLDQKKEKGRVRKAKKKFVLESTYSIDGFLTGGSVLFNDEVSTYLASVLGEVLKPYPELQNKIRIYAVKSPVVNAYTTNNGIIFVNLGLLARLENEAQLAFILSHEIIHFQNKHVINAYVNNVEIRRGRGDYRNLSLQDKSMVRSKFSQELESEADLAGVEIFLKSAYKKDSIHQVFDILKTAEFPLTWGRFDNQVFEGGQYIFPDTLELATVRKPKVDDNADDSGATHPNIRKRKRAVVRKLDKGGTGEEYKVSKTQFLKARKLAQFDLCRTYLLDHNFMEAFALGLSLQRENPESAYLREIVAKGLYGMARLRIAGKLTISEDTWTGEPERFAAFISRQSSYELSVLAIRELYRCLELSPDNEELSLMVDDLTRSFAFHEDIDLSEEFKRSASEKDISELDYPYTQYAFIGFRDVPAFFTRFEKNLSVAAKLKKESKIRKRKKKQRHSRKDKLIDVSKVVVVNPFYKKYDLHKRQKARHQESEEVLVNINDKISEAGGRLDLSTEVLNTHAMSSSQVNIMRSNSVLNDWIDEKMRSDYEGMISPIHNEAVALSAAHKTEYFAWVGGMTFKSRKHAKFFYALVGATVTPVAPLSLIYLGSREKRTLYYGLVFNIRNERLEVADFRTMPLKDNGHMMRSNLYYTLFKLKKSTYEP